MNEYISLIDAWCQYFRKRGNAQLLDPMSSRPQKGSNIRELERDLETYELRPKTVAGSEYEKGCFDHYSINRIKSGFVHEVLQEIKLSTFIKSKNRKLGRVEFSEWFYKCEPCLFEFYIFKPKSPLLDGNPESWDALKLGKKFPIEISFEKGEFDNLEVWKDRKPIPINRKPKTGPEAKQFFRVKNGMQNDVTAGFDLSGAKEVELEAKYKASRYTCRKARMAILSELYPE